MNADEKSLNRLCRRMPALSPALLRGTPLSRRISAFAKTSCKLPLTQTLIFFLLLTASSNLFALMNIEAYTGYAFGGKIPGLASTDSVTGMNFGLRYDYLYRFDYFDAGAGGYFQYTPMSYKLDDRKYALTKFSVGIDTFARLNYPNIDIHPYVRYGIAVFDKAETSLIDSSNVAVTKVEEFKFKAYYLGAGFSYPIVPMPVIEVHAFIEYLYDVSLIEKNSELREHKINIGILMAI